ncbi:MAG: glycosyltransferase [Pyrinomonadaceae bacterium]|nr:glycosyltransferase [Pyrinomonadaceae bacterium]
MLPSLQHGGAERVIVHLVNNMDRSRYVPVLALGEVEGPYRKDLREDVLVYPLGARRARNAVPAIVKAVWSLRPDTVFSTLGLNFAVAFASPLFPKGTRVVLREASSSTAFLKSVERDSRARALLYRFLSRTLYRLVDKVVCQSDHMLNDLAVNFNLATNKLVRIYNPVDIEKIRTLANQSNGSYAGPGPHLLMVGHLYHAKGCDLLLPAFRLVHQQYPDATLTLVGDGDDRSALEDLTRQLRLQDAVRFTGFQSNPYSYLKHADLLVSPSRYEGFANVILEAMVCGTPVVATDCPSGNREVVEEGVNGWLAKTEDVQSLAETICKGIVTRSSLDRDLIRARCEERFSVARIVADYERLL